MRPASFTSRHLKLALRTSAISALALTAGCTATPQTGAPAATPMSEAPAAQAPAPAPQPEPQYQPQPQPQPEPQAQSPALAPFTSSGHAEMDAWRIDFAQRAMAEGFPAPVVHETLSGLRPLSIYLGPNKQSDVSSQAEFAKPIWEYVEDTVTQSRKQTGMQKLAQMRPTFDALEARFGVDREALAAIWAMETNYGGYIGDFDAANTLANMAVEGRRRSFAERELYALMEMQLSGRVKRDELISGWAGAMGHTQFMPSTFQAWAADFEGDGHIDVWDNPADALASAANYLSGSGYNFNEPWGIEIVAPSEFDWSYADGTRRTISSWRNLGLSPITGGAFGASDSAMAELWLPAGARGPKFLLLENFDVFKTYNRSDSYAFAVGLIANNVAGQQSPVAMWPTDLERMSRNDIMSLQSSLNQLGYDAGPVDGIPGRGTKGALQAFQKANGLSADGYPTQDMLDRVQRAAAS